MVDATAGFASWVEQAGLPHSRLSAEVEALLHAVFRFRQLQGSDYYSTRLLSHFLLHCGCGLKVAQVARLLGLCRPTASTQQGLSSKEVICQAHRRPRGRPCGKLLPRYAGAIAGSLVAHQGAGRADLLDFIGRPVGARVSRIALYQFLKRFGLDHLPGPARTPPTVSVREGTSTSPEPTPPVGSAVSPAGLPGPTLMPAPVPTPPFPSPGRSTPAPPC